MKNDAREIQFAGFRDSAGIRQFTFDVIAVDRSRSRLLVTADMGLARKYNIRLQELPLLCRRLLDEVVAQQHSESISLTEQHMIAIHAGAEAAVAKPRKPKPAPPGRGSAWR